MKNKNRSRSFELEWACFLGAELGVEASRLAGSSGCARHIELRKAWALHTARCLGGYEQGVVGVRPHECKAWARGLKRKARARGAGKKPEVFNQLAEGQSPKFLVFECSDSRVCPSVLFNFQPGQTFTIRNIANMVPPYDKTKYSGIGAAVEYPVVHLKVENIIVIGHSRCGGIKALLSIKDNASLGIDFIKDWVKICTPAKEVVNQAHSDLSFEEQCSKLEKEAVKVSLENLKTYPLC
ncbi:hypothetical protein IEQ34_003730 [Dendrobium chrysotoxum]|uniref:Carbonic anhydrase n=1 Tax=Dendrobium chrysotoxum TaxID=161865 RepID=A0AAV7HDW0_DENCH|nr:hypothetical protein IEQ34_003730 [Dendrobium chrysotoxum]